MRCLFYYYVSVRYLGCQLHCRWHCRRRGRCSVQFADCCTTRGWSCRWNKVRKLKLFIKFCFKCHFDCRGV